MKKFSILFAVLLIAVMALAACSGENDNDNEAFDATPGVGNVVETESIPQTGADPTLPAVEEPVAQPTATLAVDNQMTETPEANAAGECRPYQLTSYLDYEVVGADGEEIGEVDGIVVYRDAALANGAVSGNENDINNNANNSGNAAGSENANGAPDFSAFTPGQYANPMVAFFVVDFNDAAGYGDSETLIPFRAFTALNPQTTVEDCRLVLAGSYKLENFPVWDWDKRPDFNDANWDNEWVGFWSNLGVTVNRAAPTGQALGNPVVFRDNFDDINVLNLKNEDLGEIEDFIIDPATGEMRYAVLATGGFLGIGEKLVPVPMNQVIWGNYDDDNADLGEIYINHPDNGWENAPVIENLDNVDFSVNTWADEYNTYWNTVNNGTNR